MPRFVAPSALLVAACLFGSACGRSESPASTSPATGATTATPLFAAFGGVGIVPNPLPPGYDTNFATAAFDLDASAAVSGVTVTAFDLLDGKGSVVASMKRLDHLVELPPGAVPGKGAAGSWAFYLNPPGTPFAGALPVGKTRLRVRVALDRSPADVARFRVEVGAPSLAKPIVIEGAVDGAWPT